MTKDDACEPKDPNVFRAFMSAIYQTIDAPVTAFRGNNP